MVRYRRNYIPGGTYFFTVTLADRRSSVLVEQIAALRAAFRTTRRERPFAIDAIVVLPDHLHTIMTLPSDDSDFSGRWRRIKGIFTRGVAARAGQLGNPRRDFTPWQPRFWEHTIRNESDLARHVDYVHYNPVKHGLVGSARDWPYSSFHQYVRRGLLPADWGGEIDSDPADFGERQD
jgi:putative transposase